MALSVCISTQERGNNGGLGMRKLPEIETLKARSITPANRHDMLAILHKVKNV